MSNLVKYGSYELEEAEKEEQELESGGAADFLKLVEGKNVVRFLPPPLGSKSPFLTVSQHYVKNPTGSPIVFACPRVMEKRYCPVCDRAQQYKRSGSPADEKAAREFFPKRRIFANVIDRNDPDNGPKILAFGAMIQKQLVKIRKNEDIGGDFTDPMNGFDIVIDKTGSGLNTSYTVLPARRESPLGNMEWIAMQHDLSRYAKPPTDDQLKEMLGQVGAPPSRQGSNRQLGGSAAPSAFDHAKNESDDVSW